MTAYLTSGSAIERALLCPSSVALPHNRYTTDAMTRGTVIHSFLEECTKSGRDAALETVDSEFRDVCEALDLTGLHPQLALAAEVAFAYNVETGVARELGRGAGRIYDDVREDEIPCTLDIVGIRDLEGGRRRGLYTDWKSGFRNRKSIATTTQIDFGALCVMRAYDCDIVEGQLVSVHEDIAPHVQRIVFEAWELDAFAHELRERHREWKELRAAFAMGKPPTEYEIGPWCDQCSSREFCPGQTSLLRSVLSRDLFDGPLRMSPIPDEVLASAWGDIHAAQAVLSRMKATIKAIASQRRIFLGSDGATERWLGPVVSEGNRKLDGEHVFDVIAALPDETWRESDPPITSADVAALATKVVSTQDDMRTAIKASVKRGKAAGVMRDILAKLETIDGAIVRKVSVEPKEFSIKVGISTPDPKLITGDKPDG